MPIRPYRTLLLAVGLSLAGGGMAVAQSNIGLKGPVDSVQDGVATGAGTPGSPPLGEAPLAAGFKPTTLDITPLDIPPPRRKPAVADPYAPRGIGSGALRLFPALEAGAVFSSNVNESRAKPDPAAGLRLKPALAVRSDWVRHALTAGVSGDFVTYAGGDYDERSLNAAAELRLDIRRTTVATLSGNYAYTDETAQDPAEHTLSGSGSLTQEFGRASASLRAGLLDKVYDGTSIEAGPGKDNGDRNYIEPSLSLRAAYDLSEMLKPYAEVSYAPRLHDQKPDRHGLNRDSEGYQFTAGVTLADDPIWTGDIGLTYLHRHYQDVALESADTFGLAGALTWSPTELTRIVMGVGTAIEESDDAANPATPTHRASIDVVQRLRDNVDLLGGAAITVEDNGGRYDRTYDANLGIAWKFNPNLSWTAGYDVTWLDAAAAKDSYIEHRVTTGVTITP
jgi:hypothetical protein